MRSPFITTVLEVGCDPPEGIGLRADVDDDPQGRSGAGDHVEVRSDLQDLERRCRALCT